MGKEIKPIFIEEKNLKDFENKNAVFLKKDITDSQINELKEITFNNNPDFSTQWVYFPWSGYLLKILDEKNLFRLRTNRNKNLITESEQSKLKAASISIAGLSVGSGLAIELQYSGISSSMKFAEFDILETTNLNRVKASLHEIGDPKSDYVIKKIYEINPFANLTLLSEGLNNNNLNNFLSDPTPNIVFEIIDDFEMKIRLRKKARELGIPVVSFANLGDSVLFDIERYDLDKNTELFNGVIGDLPEEILKNPEKIDKFLAVKLVGKENVPQKAIESVKEIGKTLVGRPQLSNTVAVSSSIGTYLARRIILGDQTLSGRYLVKFEDFFRE